MMNRSATTPVRRRLTTVSALSLVFALAMLLPVPSVAQSTGINGFTPIGDYIVEIDGQEQPAASILGAQQARALIILNSDLPSPVMISLGSGNVGGLNLMKIARQPNGSVNLLPDPVVQNYGMYTVDGDQIVFAVEGRNVAVKPKPVLTGNQGAAALVEYDPTYGSKRDIYTPAGDLVSELRALGDDVRVRIYFGTWCPFCGEMVPRVLKIEESLAGSNIRFEYYGLPRSISEDAEARAMNISGVPTGVVYRDGKEVGRISGNGWRSPEQAILDLLGGG